MKQLYNNLKKRPEDGFACKGEGSFKAKPSAYINAWMFVIFVSTFTDFATDIALKWWFYTHGWNCHILIR